MQLIDDQQISEGSRIAIVGIASRFPGSNDTREFFSNLIKGIEARPSSGERELRISGVDLFDWKFFGFSKNEADRLDPQQRIALEVSYEALLDAGAVRPLQFEQSAPVGVFVGVCNSAGGITSDLTDAVSRSRSGVAARLSHFFNFSGPSMSLDSDRSSSLVALHLSCLSIVTGECETALVGGVNLIREDGLTDAFERAGILAKDARCKFGDKGADGIIRSEGAAFLVLKTMDAAIRDGDRVYACIRSSAVEHVARTTDDIMSPSLIAQKRLFAKALKQGNVSANEVVFVEAHGTGTPLGDITELEAVASVYGKADRSSSCIVGSVKTNIGHTESVCGFAGLIKAALALKSRRLPPSLHVRNPISELEGRKIALAQGVSELPEKAIAAVSAFGLTGTLAHVLLESVPSHRPDSKTKLIDKKVLPVTTPILLSAPDLKQLVSYMSSIAKSVSEEGVQITDIAYTALYRRPHFGARSVIVAESSKDFCEKVVAFAENGLPGKDVWVATPELAPLSVQVSLGSQPHKFIDLVRRLLLTNFREALQDQIVRIQSVSSQFGVNHLEEEINRPGEFEESNQNRYSFLCALVVCELLRERAATEIIYFGTGILGLVADVLNGSSNIEDVWSKVQLGQSSANSKPIDSLSRSLLFSFEPSESVGQGFLMTFDDQAPADSFNRLWSWLWVQGQPAEPILEEGVLVELRSPVFNRSLLSPISDSKLSVEPENHVGKSTPKSKRDLKLVAIRSADQSEIQHRVLEYLFDVLREELGLDSEQQVGRSTPFRELGVSSISAIDLSRVIGKDLNLKITAAVFFNYPNLDSLTQYLTEEVSKVQHKNLGQILVDNRVLNSRSIREAAEEQRMNPEEKIGAILLRKGLISKEDLEHALRMQKEDPIAVVGMAFRLPGAQSEEQLWRLLMDGHSTISAPPEDRRKLYRGTKEKMFPTFPGGYISEVDMFDPEFFGISPREASQMDPQQRLLLKTVWMALEDAGITARAASGSSGAVFVGIMNHNDYTNLKLRRENPDSETHFDSTSDAISIAAGRISYFLNLKGPCLAIDTACSSSLVAVHEACRAIAAGDASFAVAGGVNLILSNLVSSAFGNAKMLSPTGQCHSFDQSADGYVRSEGCGVVVLKKLSQALADKNRVLALIPGSAVNHGGRSSGLVAPNGLAQEQLIRTALATAGISPAQVGYLEAHGTGTRLGDPIEVGAISRVFENSRQNGQVPPLLVSSVKANVGHLEAGAGVVGLIKSILVLRHGIVPPQAGLKQVNAELKDFLGNCILISNKAIPWPKDYRTKILGVSSFGYNGANAHVILEEPRKVVGEAASGVDAGVQLFMVSARTQQAIKALKSRYVEMLKSDGEILLTDLCLSILKGRDHFQYRSCYMISNTAQLLEALEKDSESSEMVSSESAVGLIAIQTGKFLDIPYSKIATASWYEPANYGDSEVLRHLASAAMIANYVVTAGLNPRRVVSSRVGVLGYLWALGVINASDAMATATAWEQEYSTEQMLSIVEVSATPTLEDIRPGSTSVSQVNPRSWAECIQAAVVPNTITIAFGGTENGRVNDSYVVSDRSSLLECLRQMYLSGAVLDFPNAVGGNLKTLVKLPHYPLSEASYWL